MVTVAAKVATRIQEDAHRVYICARPVVRNGTQNEDPPNIVRLWFASSIDFAEASRIAAQMGIECKGIIAQGDGTLGIRCEASNAVKIQKKVVPESERMPESLVVLEHNHFYYITGLPYGIPKTEVAQHFADVDLLAMPTSEGKGGEKGGKPKGKGEGKDKGKSKSKGKGSLPNKPFWCAAAEAHLRGAS